MQDDRPSPSAAAVALARALETELPPDARLFADPFAHLFLRGFGRVVLRVCRRPALRRLLLGANDRLVPGARGISVGRTRFIDDALRCALARGVVQLLVLGAGYDTRGLRIEGVERVAVFEVDHPATQRRKREVLEPVLGRWPEHLHLVPVDFEREDLGKALQAAGFCEGRPTLAIWEGVTEYLSEAAVEAVLRWFAGAAGPGSEIVFTYTDRGLIDGSKQFPGGARLLALNRRGGEPYRFGFEPACLRSALAEAGLELVEDAAGEAFRRRYFEASRRRLRGNEYERTARARVPSA
jgi:methyltransferase (TIGR00027 family)